MSKRLLHISATIIISLATFFANTGACANKKTTSAVVTTSQQQDKKTAAQIDAFIDNFVQYMVDKHDYDEEYLYDLFDNVTVNKLVISRMNKPFEAKPWYIYQRFFLTDDRISKGTTYWQNHAATLKRAEQKYGVPASIIVAILGVETEYGNRKGNFSVLESLSTLAFNYPSRAKFFKKELEHFLLLSREQKLDPLKITGSHAGAIGLPQFMPSSYRQYAVDFSGKHQIDLVNNDQDAIGSIANYLKRNGWKRNGLIANPAVTKGTKYKDILPTSHVPKKPSITPKQLSNAGIKPAQKTTLENKLTFFDLKNKKDSEYWIGYNNFYVISRYNRNKHYAMAVYQLSNQISQARNKQLAKSKKQLKKLHGKRKT